MNLLANNHLMTINIYFNMVRMNSHINQYQDMWPVYKECIRVIIDDYLPNRVKHEVRANFEQQFLKVDAKGINFDPLTIEEEPEDVLNNIVASIKNMRKNIATD